MRFSDYDWARVAKGMDDEGAKIIRLTPDFVQIYLYPYGHIEIFDNGGEVNVHWNHIQGLELPLHDSVRVADFALFYSVPYDTSPKTKERELGRRIKNAIEEEIKVVKNLVSGGYLYLPLTATTPEIRVVKGGDDLYHLQTREPGKLWETQMRYAVISDAMKEALEWDKSKADKKEIYVCEFAHEWSDKLKKAYHPKYRELVNELLNELSQMPNAKASAVAAYILDDLRDDDYRTKCFLSDLWNRADKEN